MRLPTNHLSTPVAAMPQTPDITDDVADAIAQAIEASDAERLYLFVWGEGYAEPGDPIVGIHLFAFFSEENGYRDRDRDMIQQLAFGESTTITDLADVQSVVRVR
jgi:hypothetical protein